MLGVNCKENEKREATMLKIVSCNSTSAILNQPPEEPKPSQTTVEAAIDIDAVLDLPVPRTDENASPPRSLCCEDTHKSPPSSPGYLDNLLEKLTDLETLEEKLTTVLDNQKVFFLLMSKSMGDVAQLSRNVSTNSEESAFRDRFFSSKGAGWDSRFSNSFRGRFV